MASQNWDDHDRSNRYVAPDYAKNLLNSLAPNELFLPTEIMIPSRMPKKWRELGQMSELSALVY